MINIEAWGNRLTRRDGFYKGHKGLWISDNDMEDLKKKLKQPLPIKVMKESIETFLILSLIDETGNAKRMADKINTILLGYNKNK